MILKSKLLKITFSLFIILLSYVEFTFCNGTFPSDSTRDGNWTQHLDSFRVEIKSEQSRFDSLKREFSELKIQMANKYLDWASYVLAAITLVAAFFTGIMSLITYQRFRDVSEIHLTILKEVSDYRVKILESRETIDNLIRKLKDEIESSKEIIVSLTEGFKRDLEALKVMVENLITEETQTVNEKARKIVNKEANRFRQTIITSTSIALNLVLEIIEKAGIVVEKEKLDKARDEAFKASLYLYDLNSFIGDLTSDKKEERIRAIWGIEGMGTKENIKDLQEIADNKDEGPDIRVEAQRSVDNMKRRFGLA